MLRQAMRVGVLVAIGTLGLALLATAAGPNDHPIGPTQAYGPCCPQGHGKPPMTMPDGSLQGPRFSCRHLDGFSLAYGGQTYRVDAVEAADAVLVPEPVLGVIGATIQAAGGRETTVSLGARTVRLTLGSRAVTVGEGNRTTKAAWDLCPRLLGGLTYVPLRATAEALGLTVGWREGTVTLRPTSAGAGTAPTAGTAECPASRVETALGITVVRGSATSPFGSGVSVIAVTEGGHGAELGLRPNDIILQCDGKAVACPKDLDAIVAANQDSGKCVCELEVARGDQTIRLARPAGVQ